MKSVNSSTSSPSSSSSLLPSQAAIVLGSPEGACSSRKLRIGDAHLVQIGIAGELKERRILILPAKLADRLFARREVVHERRATANVARLVRCEVQKGRVRRGIHQPQ